ncbi:MAG TPA: hypothetical protein VI685_08955 [Candidatus Angelobacter sp.]
MTGVRAMLKRGAVIFADAAGWLDFVDRDIVSKFLLLAGHEDENRYELRKIINPDLTARKSLYSRFYRRDTHSVTPVFNLGRHAGTAAFAPLTDFRSRLHTSERYENLLPTELRQINDWTRNLRDFLDSAQESIVSLSHLDSLLRRGAEFKTTLLNLLQLFNPETQGSVMAQVREVLTAALDELEKKRPFLALVGELTARYDQIVGNHPVITVADMIAFRKALLLIQAKTQDLSMKSPEDFPIKTFSNELAEKVQEMDDELLMYEATEQFNKLATLADKGIQSYSDLVRLRDQAKNLNRMLQRIPPSRLRTKSAMAQFKAMADAVSRLLEQLS